MSVRSIQPPPEVKAVHELAADPAMTALADATPAEIDAWLATNASTLAGVRRVLALLLRVAVLYLRERAGR